MNPELTAVTNRFSRRQALLRLGSAMAAFTLGTRLTNQAGTSGPENLEKATFDFIRRCARPDGGYAASPDPDYTGNSDTGASDLAAVTYAATLAKTMGWHLPEAGRSAEFVQGHQLPDGSFVNFGGKMDPKADLSVLYNTVQGVVALRALGRKPKVDPASVMTRFFASDAYKKLPWYTTSFFPLFYAALGKPFPREQDEALRQLQLNSQAADGYLGDHVAASFHMAHYFRLIGQPTPRAEQMLKRVLRDQRSDGGWNIKEPDWDVHACFDAVFILRQLGGDSEPVRQSIRKAAGWALSCRNPDGGFGHYPGWHSDMDAVYFQFGTLIQAGEVAGVKRLRDAHTLGWGHAMLPGKIYTSS